METSVTNEPIQVSVVAGDSFNIENTAIAPRSMFRIFTDNINRIATLISTFFAGDEIVPMELNVVGDIQANAEYNVDEKTAKINIVGMEGTQVSVFVNDNVLIERTLPRSGEMTAELNNLIQTDMVRVEGFVARIETGVVGVGAGREPTTIETGTVVECQTDSDCANDVPACMWARCVANKCVNNKIETDNCQEISSYRSSSEFQTVVSIKEGEDIDSLIKNCCEAPSTGGGEESPYVPPEHKTSAGDEDGDQNYLRPIPETNYQSAIICPGNIYEPCASRIYDVEIFEVPGLTSIGSGISDGSGGGGCESPDQNPPKLSKIIYDNKKYHMEDGSVLTSTEYSKLTGKSPTNVEGQDIYTGPEYEGRRNNDVQITPVASSSPTQSISVQAKKKTSYFLPLFY